MPLPPPVSSQQLHRSRSNGALPVAPSPAPPSTRGGKLKVTLELERGTYTAGQTVRGVLELSVQVRKGHTVGLGAVGVELAGLAELRSRTHTSTRRLLTQRRDFQGNGQPPSAAVALNSPPLQGDFYPALPGTTRFDISFPLPADAPSSCSLGGNATVRYELRAFAHALIDGQVDIRSAEAEVVVVERWVDWRKGPWAVEGGIERKMSEKLALERDGKVEVVASVGKGEWVERPPRLFWRRDGENGIEGKAVVRVNVKVRNASKRHVTGIKLTLLRRLRLLPAPGTPSATHEDAPIVTSTIVTERFHGVDYDVPLNDQKDVVVALQVPPDVECWSVRRAALFEIDTSVRVEVECGFLAKNLFVDLPIWIAHPLSLSNSVHRFAAEEARRIALPSPHGDGYHPPPPASYCRSTSPASYLPPPSPAGGVPYHRPSSPDPSVIGFPMPHSPSSSVGFGQSPVPHSPSQYYPYPASNPNSPLASEFASAPQAEPGQLPFPGMVSPPLAQGGFAPAPSPAPYAESTISIAPSVATPAPPFGFYPQPVHTPAPPPHPFPHHHFQHPQQHQLHFSAPPPPPSLSQVYHHPAQAAPYVAFNPSAPDLTPSRFLGGVLTSSQPTHSPGAAISAEAAQASSVALPAPSSPPRPYPSPAPSSVVPHARPIKEILPHSHMTRREEEEVDKVLSTPVRPYSAAERAHQSPRTASGMNYSPDRKAAMAERERRKSLEKREEEKQQQSPPRPCPSPVPSLRRIERAGATPPPPASPSSHFSSRRSPSPSPSRSPVSPSGYTPTFPALAASLSQLQLAEQQHYLETIGEDGESQAGGTGRSGMVTEGVREALAAEGRENAEREEREERERTKKEKEREKEREKEEKQSRRRSVAQELEQWVERADEEREERRRSGIEKGGMPNPPVGIETQKSLPPLPSPATAMMEETRPSAREIFPASTSPSLPPPKPTPSPSQSLLSARDPSGLSALEKRLLARSPSPSKSPLAFPSSSSSASPPLPPLPPSSSPNLSAPPSSSDVNAGGALRARSISRASRLVEDEDLRKKIEEAERDPGEVVRRMRALSGGVVVMPRLERRERKPLPKPTPTTVEKREEREERTLEVKEETEAEKIKREYRRSMEIMEKEEEHGKKEEQEETRRSPPARYEQLVAAAPKEEATAWGIKQDEESVVAYSAVPPAASSPSKNRPTFASSTSSSSKRHTLPALPVSSSTAPLSPVERTETPFLPPTSFTSIPSAPPAAAPVAAVIKRGSSPLSTTSAAPRPNPWSSTSPLPPSTSAPFLPCLTPSRSSTLPQSPTSSSAVPVSPIDTSGRKVVDPSEQKGLKKEAVGRIAGWLRENGLESVGSDAGAGQGGSLTVFENDAIKEDNQSRKRRTIEFGRLAPAPPSSSAVGMLSPSLTGTGTTPSSGRSAAPLSGSISSSALSHPAGRHKHSHSVPCAASLAPPPPTSHEPTVAQLLAAETRAALRSARIGSPPPWGAKARAGRGESPVVKGTEGYLAALKRDEEGGEKREKIEAYRSARGGKGGKVTSVVGIWAERVEEAEREGAASPPLPPSSPVPPPSSSSRTRGRHKSAHSLSSLSPFLSSSTSAKPLTSTFLSNTSAPAPSRPRFGSAAPSPSGGRSSPAKPFLNTTLPKPSSSSSASPAAALRVPSGGGKMSTSESAPQLAGARSVSLSAEGEGGQGQGGGNKVKELLARYQQQIA